MLFSPPLRGNVELGITAYTFNSSTWEAEEDTFLQILGCSGLHGSQNYVKWPCLKNQKQMTKKVDVKSLAKGVP